MPRSVSNAGLSALAGLIALFVSACAGAQSDPTAEPAAVPAAQVATGPTSAQPAAEPQLTTKTAVAIEVSSPAFSDGRRIPRTYTCEGDSHLPGRGDAPIGQSSPALEWGPVPSGTKSIALIADDQTGPGIPVTHWLVYAIPPDVTELAKAVPRNEALASGARQGVNDFDEVGYSGPCDVKEFHLYHFTVYALDTTIDLPQGATASDVRSAMDNRVLAQGELTTKYRKIDTNPCGSSFNC